MGNISVELLQMPLVIKPEKGRLLIAFPKTEHTGISTLKRLESRLQSGLEGGRRRYIPDLGDWEIRRLKGGIRG